jgi:uncharacterized delta-60 repeat protein
MQSWRVRPVICAAAAWGALALAPPALAAPGDLDTGGFGTAGIFTAPPQATAFDEQAVSIDAEGRALIAFTRDVDLDGKADTLVAGRLTASGVLDPSFNPLGPTPGLHEIDFSGMISGEDYVVAADVRPSGGGTVTVLGTVWQRNPAYDRNPRVALVRLTTQGALDSTFGNGGRMVDTTPMSFYSIGNALEIDSQGRALVAGTQLSPTYPSGIPSGFVYRYTTAGLLDGTWGTEGRRPIVSGSAAIQLHDIRLLSGDGAVVAGQHDLDTIAARVTPAGALDGTFGGDGIATTELGRETVSAGWAYAVAVDSQNRVVVGGQSNVSGARAAAARFTSAGEPDASFGNGTPQPGVTFLPDSMTRITDVIVGCEDRLLVAGSGRYQLPSMAFTTAFSIGRLTSAGVLDATFAPSEAQPGVAQDRLGESARGTSLAVDAQARAYIAGSRSLPFPPFDVKLAVVRRLDATGCAPGEQPPGPPTPPSEPPPTTPPPTGGAGGSRPVASFGGPLRPGSFTRTTFDASASSGAVGYRWDLSGDGRDDVACGADQPLVTTRLASMTRTGSTTVRLTAIGADGSTSTSSQAVAVASSSTSQRLTNSVAQPISCASSRTSVVNVRVCTRETVDFGVVSAAGCFERVDGRAGVPRGELPILDAAIAYFNANDRRTDYVVRMCQELRGRNCTIKEGVITRAEVDPLLQASDLRISRSMVKVNGLEFHPQSGATIAVFPQIGRVISSNAIVKFGDATVPIARQVNLDVEGSGPVSGNLYAGSGRVSVISFAPKIPFTDLAGFGLDGEVRLDLVRSSFNRYSEAAFRLALPNDFSLFGGKPPSAAASMRADNANGPELEDLEIRFPEADLGALKLSDVRFRYAKRGGDGCPAKYWKATAQIDIGAGTSSAGFRLAPDPPQNGVAFCQGEFKSAGGEFTFPSSSRPQIFPGVFLKSINFATQLKPTLLRGGVGITALDITEVDGALLAVFASPAQPYTLTRGDMVEGLEPLGKLAGEKLQSTTFAAGGTFGFELPVIGRVEFGSGYWLYAYPDYLALGGRVLIPGPGVVIRGEFDGEIGVGRGLYSFRGKAEACIAGGISDLGCIGGEAWVTSKGFVVCGSILGEIHPGVGYKWGDTFPEIWTALPGDGCKPSGYWVDVPISSAARAAQSGARTFTLKAGVRALRVRIVGRGGAPDVELRGPDGEAISTATADYVRGTRINLMRHRAGGATWADIRNGRPGTYTITPRAGSAPIASLATSEPAQTPKITARVSGSGARRTLTYTVGATPRGQQVTFYERGGSTLRRIGTTTKAAGTLTFTPGDGAGARTITALVEAQGLRVAEPTVARYRLTRQRAGRPGALRVVRRGRAVTVSWGAAPGAARYGVVVSPSSGPQRILRLAATRRSLRLTGAAAARGGTVRVAALDAQGAAGPARAGRWRPAAAPQSRFRPFRELRARSRR